MSVAQTSLNEFADALSAATRASGIKFVWGADPADDPRVKEFRKLQREAEAFREWHQGNPVRLAGMISRDTVGEELNRAIARAPNIASARRSELFEGAFAVLDIDDKREYEKFRKAHWLYGQRTQVLSDQSLDGASERHARILGVAGAIQAADAAPDIAKLLPGLALMLQAGAVFPADENPAPEWEGLWAIAAACAAALCGGLYILYKSAENFTTGAQNKLTKQVNDHIKSAQQSHAGKIAERAERAEEVLLETTNVDLLRERQACIERERTHGRIMDRVCAICDEKHGMPGIDDPHLRRECIRRGASELKDRIDGQRIFGAEQYNSFTEAMLKGDIFDICRSLLAINIAGERLRGEAIRSAQEREQKVFAAWTSLQCPDIFQEDSRLWF